MSAQPTSVADAVSPADGRSVFPEGVWRQLASMLRLSGREAEILQGVFDDQKEACIAANLGISTHTVHSHLERLYRKLGVSSRVALVVRVFRAYLLEGISLPTSRDHGSPHDVQRVNAVKSVRRLFD